ncbi:bacterial NAD-glutamate dehydrogenase family protein, partial [Vibrio parahaemolyticus EKP-008]
TFLMMKRCWNAKSRA